MSKAYGILDLIESVYFMSKAEGEELLEFDESTKEYQKQLIKLAINYASSFPFDHVDMEKIYSQIIVTKVEDEVIPFRVQSQFLFLFIHFFSNILHNTRVSTGATRFREIVEANPEDNMIAFWYALGTYTISATHILLFDPDEKEILEQLDSILSRHAFDKYYAAKLEIYRTIFQWKMSMKTDNQSSLNYLPKINKLISKTRSMDLINVVVKLLGKYKADYIVEIDNTISTAIDVLNDTSEFRINHQILKAKVGKIKGNDEEAKEGLSLILDLIDKSFFDEDYKIIIGIGYNFTNYNKDMTRVNREYLINLKNKFEQIYTKLCSPTGYIHYRNLKDI